MKKQLLLGVIMISCLLGTSQNGLEGIVVEKFYVSDEADSINAYENFATYPLHVGSVTYRVYANLLPGYKVIQIFGNETHPLNISTSTSFYNDPNYGFNIYQGTSLANTKKHTTLIDSYLTIGGVANGLMGVLKSEDTDGTIGNIQGILANNDLSAGAPITGAEGKDGLMPGTPAVPNTLGLSSELDVFDQTPGSVFETTGGTVVVLGGVEGLTSSNHVLIGQFTTDGVLDFCINIQIATPIPGESELYVSSNPGVGEITDSTLCYTSPPIVNNVTEMASRKTSQFNIFPNPCADHLIVKQYGSSDNAQIQILDITGRIVYSSQQSSSIQHVNTSELTPGLYSIQLTKNGKTEAQKFVKQ
jgi:Secretion system C-terminal sorting domain